MHKKRRYFYLFLLVLLLCTTTLWIIKIDHGTVPYLDQWSRDFVENLAGTKFYFLCRWLTELGSGTFLTPLTIIMGAVLWRMYRDWFTGMMFAGGTLLSYVINIAIKVMVARERPRIFAAAEAEGYSFPSGHAMISMVCYGLLLYFITRKLKSKKAVITVKTGLPILIIVIGISRYMIRVHYLTDVLAGFGFGLLFVLIWIKLYEYLKQLRTRTTPS
ncbi:phosphatase PAP2 family protein [Virgibacillus dakarensis]|uniref:Phosphatidylglycerophosphatase B n=1 Tax=Lentibacillus populi TaxID=1827502 RepID=A0A9W5TZI5_9BACI|nr:MULTISPECIES: phosphatase PAP2 family protein [Bacillaceae]MBT2215337.1 phosphatase PAP2 family protein [Virgibacillus dakarensis]MTW85495.1 phosphatase PAP2 family protein [Virgibacillus dakarensis]GGB51657.1 phosphatidylglycerophosphatase B [Lentibacillus populi]